MYMWKKLKRNTRQLTTAHVEKCIQFSQTQKGLPVFRYDTNLQSSEKSFFFLN